MTMLARPGASLTDYPGIAGSEPPTVLDARLDLVSEHLAEADVAIAEMVRRLQPILPMGFGETARPEDARAPRDPEASLLAARLSDIADRAHSLVLYVRSVVEAVDL